MSENRVPKYIIVGGVAGGATAAARIRRNTENAQVILFEKGEYISYANCGLPYYIEGNFEDWQKLIIRSVEEFEKNNIHIAGLFAGNGCRCGKKHAPGVQPRGCKKAA